MNPSDVMKALPTEVVKEIYSDAVADTLKEASKVGVDFAKTVRLVLFPLQFTGMMQDRLARYIQRSINRVSSENRIEPVESLASQIAERLRSQEDGSVITEMYVSLLSRAMDKDHVGEAHPAFIHVVGQLAPDEAVLVEQLSHSDPSIYTRPSQKSDAVMLKADREKAIRLSGLTDTSQKILARISIRPEDLSQPDLIYTYVEHLVSLGLVSYTNDPWTADFKGAKLHECDFWFVRLNGFGQLFHRACLSTISSGQKGNDGQQTGGRHD